MSSESFDAAEVVPVELAPSTPLTRTVQLPEYWKLFWVPAIGAVPALVYELLVTLLAPPGTTITRGVLLRHLGLRPDELRSAMLELDRARLLERSGEGALRLIFPPPVMVGPFARERLSGELADAHRAYLGAHGYDLSRLDPPPVTAKQLSIIDDDPPAPAAPDRAVAKGRQVSPDARQLVEHFREQAAKKLQIPRGDFEIRDYGMEMRVANAFLKDYSLAEAKAIIDQYFTADPAAARVSSLKEIRGKHALLFNQVRNGATSARPMVDGFGRRHKVVAPAVGGYRPPSQPTSDVEKKEGDAW